MQFIPDKEMKKKTLLESLQCGLLAKPTKKIDQIHFKWRKQTRNKLNSKWKIMQKNSQRNL